MLYGMEVYLLQLGMEHKIKTALRFALAVSIIEYPYAWIAVVFEGWVTSSPVIVNNFQLITAIVMTVIGIGNIFTAAKPNPAVQKFQDSGFRRGIILSILNPLALPFWIGITAYLKAQGWLDIATPLRQHSYILGTSVGVLVLLVLFIKLAKKLSVYAQQDRWIKLVPGITILALGLFAFAKYFLG